MKTNVKRGRGGGESEIRTRRKLMKMWDKMLPLKIVCSNIEIGTTFSFLRPEGWRLEKLSRKTQFCTAGT